MEGFQVLLSLCIYIYERSYSVCGKERVGTACIYMSSVIHRENLGGYLGLIMPFDSFFDTRADTALMKGCGLGMRCHCQKETSHKGDTLCLLSLQTKDCIRATSAIRSYQCGGRNNRQPRDPMGEQCHFSYYLLNHF